jgi:hypothetical protein
MMQKTLSDKIFDSAKKIVAQWLKDNPDYSLLDMAQQLNYSALQLKTLGSESEEKYKSIYKPKYGATH